MAKATGKSAAKAGKAAAAGIQKAAEPPKGKLIAVVSAKALSTDVGPAVIAGLSQSYVDESKAHDLMRGVQSKRYDLMAQTTQAIVKAAKADPNIDLSAAFAGDAKKMNFLNDQLGLCLGFREKLPFTNAQGDTVERIVYAKAVNKYFPTNKDNKGTDEYKRKGTLRSNFLHLLKKCTQAAVAIVERKIDMEMDKESGTLLLSGPAIQKQFGSPEVLLNEKQTVGEGDDAVKLNVRPSFTEMASMAAADHGAVVKRGGTVAHRGQKIGSNKPEDVIKAQCDALIASLAKLKDQPSDKMVESLTKLRDAMDKHLD